MTDIDIERLTVELFEDVSRRIADTTGPMSEAELIGIGGSLARLVDQAEPYFAHQAELGFGSRDVVGLSGARKKHIATHSAPTLWLSIFEFAAGEPTKVHDHGGWGVIYGLTGVDRVRLFERLTEDADKDVALRQVREWTIRQGEIAWWYDSPRNIHQQEAVGDERALCLVLMGHDPTGLQQRQYDLDTRTSVTVPYVGR